LAKQVSTHFARDWPDSQKEKRKASSFMQEYVVLAETFACQAIS